MFKNQFSEKDLLSEMEKNLKVSLADNKQIKLNKAIELITKASEVFEASGLIKQADQLINVLESLGSIKDKVKLPTSYKAPKSEPIAFELKSLIENEDNEDDEDDEKEFFEIKSIKKKDAKKSKTIKELLKNMNLTGTPFAFDESDLNDLELDDEDLSVNDLEDELALIDISDSDDEEFEDEV